METITLFLENYPSEVMIGLIGTTFFLLLINIINQVRISAITKKYNRLVNGVKEGSLEDMLLQHIENVKDVEASLKDVQAYCTALDKRLRLSIQKVGFVRYNAFDDMGSDISFSVALLNDQLNGFIITSLYGRNESNTYGKPIVNGESKYQLSVEEMQALDRAIKG